MQDKEIVDLYWARSEDAVAETEKKYGRYCHYIAYQILGNDEDANEVVSEAYFKAWNTIPPQKPDKLKPYLGMISRQLALDAYEALHTQKRGGRVALLLDELSECIPDNDSCDDIGESIALREALNEFVRSLPDNAQKVFVRRYWYASSVAEIAKAYFMKESSVTVLLMRTRRKLKEFLKKEGFDI